MRGGAGWKRRSFGRHIILIGATLAIPSAGPAQVNGTWINPNGGTWVDAANWNSNPSYPDGGGMAVFPANTWNASTISLGNSGITLSELSFHGPTGYTISTSGSITLVGPSIIHVDEIAGTRLSTISSGSLSAAVHGVHGLTKNGHGALSLRDASYTGGTTINAGTILFDRNTVGVGLASNTITLNGGAIAGFSRLDQLIGVTSAGGTIGFYRPNQFNGSLILAGGISGTGTVAFQGGRSQEIYIEGDVATTGAVLVNTADSVRFRNSGRLTSASSLKITGTVLLRNDGTTSTLSDRIKDDIPISLENGQISSGGFDPAHPIETLGTVTLSRGVNSLGATLQTPQIDRLNHSILITWNSDVSPSLRITDSLPSKSGLGAFDTPEVGIISWANSYRNWQYSFPVTIEDGYVRALRASEYIYSVPSEATQSNLRLDGSATILNATSVNSLTIVDGTLSGTGTLAVSSGGVFIPFDDPFVNVPVSATIRAPIDFGASEGIIHGRIRGGLTGPMVVLDGPISGSGGITIAADAGLRGAKSYTGQTVVYGALTIYEDVIPGQDGPLGLDISPIVLDGTPSLILAPLSTPLFFGRDIHVMPSRSAAAIQMGRQEIPGGADVTLGGNIHLEGPLSISTDRFNARRLTLAGDITGIGQIEGLVENITPSAYIRLTGNNSFTGGLEVRGGTWEVGSDTALGAGTFWFGSANVAAVNGPRVLRNNIFMKGDSGSIVGSNPLTFTGSVNLRGRSITLTVLNSATTTLSGPIFNGSLIKAGAGLLDVSNIRLPSLTVSGGALKILQNGGDTGTSRTNALTIAAGASMDLTNNDVILDYTGASPIASVQQALVAARLFSSVASGVTGLGFGENAELGYTTFSGQPVDSTTVIVAYTYLGDADLDNAVDLNDYDNFLTGFIPAETAATWTSGDFDYSGVVNLTDFELYLHGYYALGGSSAAIAGAVQNSPVSEQDKQAMLTLVATVPEPVFSGIVGLSIPWLLRRKRICRAG